MAAEWTARVLRVVGWVFWIISLVFLAGWALLWLAFSRVYGWPSNEPLGIVLIFLTFSVAPGLLVGAALFLRRGQCEFALAMLGIAWLSFTALFAAAA